MKTNRLTPNHTPRKQNPIYDYDHPNHGNLPDRKCDSIRKNLVWAVALATPYLIGVDGGLAFISVRLARYFKWRRKYQMGYR